ncbi:hypothetical protein MMC19_002283 [Ptychographa xylographoides]|nr:hypothetical protein [Ptychographa xylographoides]
MEIYENGRPQRTVSQTSSITSSKSRKSSKARVKLRKHSSALSSTATTPTTANTDKSLTSFPSLSPENSPDPRNEGNYNASRFSHAASGTAKKRQEPHHPSIVESLTANSPSFRGRSALFDDSPTSATQHVPGALHYASDEHIRRLVARTGAVVLVRQLAEDLAQRDAEMTAFRRRAEERERELKKMLREVEVSNLDIETRLYHLDNPTTEGPKGKSEAMKDERLRGGKARASTGPSGMDEIIRDAIKDDLDDVVNVDVDYMDSLAGNDKQATIRGKAVSSRDADDNSTSSSIDSPENPKGTMKGWKDYLWSGPGTSRKTSRASSIMSGNDKDLVDAARARAGSGTALRRKGLNGSLFQPPSQFSFVGESAVFETNDTEVDRTSEKSRASSMTSWTLKLFAGNPSATRDTEWQNTVRGRSVTNGDGTQKERRAGSMASVQTASSAKASLMKVSSRSSATQPLRRQFQPLNLGSAGNSKSSSQSLQSIPPGSPASVDTASQLGPVEMDTILPHGSRPPTLTPSYQNMDDASDYLTDRFGFIYDQRRRRKETEGVNNLKNLKGTTNKEMLSNSKDSPESDVVNVQQQLPTRPDTPASSDERVEGKSGKKWQDYLKIATFPTELLSQTPAPGSVMQIANADIKASLKRSPTFGESGVNPPTQSPNPLPSASSITAGNAEIAKPSITAFANPAIATTVEAEPVKLLLAQLTELHDSLQRDKTIKWNEFLRRIRAERRKEGETASAIDARSQQAIMPEASLADGEIIGIATLGSKGRVGRAKYKEFKSLVLAGIPVAHRAKIWAECSGATGLRIPGYYDDLVTNGVDDPVILAQIQMDINRTLTDNVYFRQGPGVVKLNEVLLAYSRRNAEVGYCQGMNLITASLLLIMPTAEDAFWILVSMIENILPRHYYDNSLLTSRADQQVLRQYVTELLPKLSGHLDALGIELEALTFQWFLSLFTDCLSAEALFRVWDVLLCCKDEDGNGGSTFLFQVALALLKLNETQLVSCATPGEVYTYLGGEITNHAISIDGLIRASEGLKGLVRRTEVEDRRAKWVAFEEQTIREREAIRQGGQIGKENNSGDEGVTTDESEAEHTGVGNTDLQAQSPRPAEA